MLNSWVNHNVKIRCLFHTDLYFLGGLCIFKKNRQGQLWRQKTMQALDKY